MSRQQSNWSGSLDGNAGDTVIRSSGWTQAVSDGTNGNGTSVRLTARRFVTCSSTAYPTYGPSGKTTGPRARTFRFGDASGSDQDSNRPPRPSGSCRFMPPPTTHSMSAVTSPPPARTGSFEPRRSRHGVMRLASQPEPAECGPHRGHARQCDKPAALRNGSPLERLWIDMWQDADRIGSPG